MEAAQSGSGGAWQSGGLLVMERTAVLPARCVRCNREVSPHWREEVRESPLWRAGAFVYPILGWTPKVPLCEEHQEEIRKKRASARVRVLFSLLLCVLALGFANNPLVGGIAMIAFLCVFATGLVAAVRASPVRVKRTTDRHVWFAEVNPDYLSSLPLAPPELS
jgi:hypothetical protein